MAQAQQLVEEHPASGLTVHARRAGGWQRRLAAVRAWPLTRQFLLALVVLYLGKQAIMVVLFPAFSGHDEVAHYSYLRTVATDHRIPVLPELDEWRTAYEADPESVPGDFLGPDLYQYCEYVLRWNCYSHLANSPPYAITFLDEYYPFGLQYAANHPPLYYIMMTPLYWVSDGASLDAQHYLLRAAAIPFGLATVLFAYLMARAIFPRDRFLAITVPAFVAFQPQISYEAAMLNNDILAIALYSALLHLLVIGIRDRFPWRTCVLAGFVLGLALLAKGTSVTAVPLVAVAVIAGVGWRNVRGWLARGSAIAGLAAVLSVPWFIFLYRTYGNVDGFSQVEALQSWWNYYGVSKPSILDQLWDRDFALMRWRETWGEFGWRKIRLSDSLLWWIGVPCLVALAGLVVYTVLAARRTAPWGGEDEVMRPQRWQVAALALLFLTAVVAYVAMLQFGTRFELTQARYYFPAINAVALLLMLGLRTLIPRRFHVYGQATVFAALLMLTVVIATQYAIPYWHV